MMCDVMRDFTASVVDARLATSALSRASMRCLPLSQLRVVRRSAWPQRFFVSGTKKNCTGAAHTLRPRSWVCRRRVMAAA